MSSSQAFWNKHAAKYAASKIANMDSYDYTTERTRSYLAQDHQVLEIGAGTGRTALALAPNVREMVVTDFSDAMLDVGRAEAKEAGLENISFECRDATDMPEGPYDVILAHNILHLVEDLEGVLAEAYANLKPGGLLISKTFVKPDRGLHLFIRFMLLVVPMLQLIGKAPFVNIPSLSALEGAHRWGGFEIIESANYLKDSRRYLVARKV